MTCTLCYTLIYADIIYMFHSHKNSLAAATKLVWQRRDKKWGTEIKEWLTWDIIN